MDGPKKLENRISNPSELGRVRKIMKLDRRSFIRLIPLGLAATFVSSLWWISREPAMTSQATGTTSVTSQAATAITPQALQTESTTSVAPQPTLTTPEGFDFPVTWNGDQPTKVDANEYRLRIDGDVPNPLELTLENLLSMSSVQRKLRIDCVDGWTAEVLWEGIPLSYLLRLAGASPEKIAYVTVESVTGYKITMSSELGEVTDPDNMIALKAGGLPLTVEHGYPARLVAGGEWAG